MSLSEHTRATVQPRRLASARPSCSWRATPWPNDVIRDADVKADPHGSMYSRNYLIVSPAGEQHPDEQRERVRGEETVGLLLPRDE